MALLTLRNLHLSYGDPALIDGIDLSIEPGERICLVGRNGEGKSTLLKLIDGELKPDDGERVVSQGLRISRLTQDVPEQLHGSVFDVVADGVGATAELVKRYHSATLALVEDSSDAALGREIYISEGCAYCHTQAVRPIVTDLGLGPVSQPGDYAHEEPVLLGTARMGPDLMHLAARGGTTEDHLRDPREERPWSTMPSYDYLSTEDLEALVSYLNGLN